MDKIQIAYWKMSAIPGLPYNHLEEVEYTDEKLLTIVSTVIGQGYSVMIRPTLDNGLLIWIDKGRFGQS